MAAGGRHRSSARPRLARCLSFPSSAAHPGPAAGRAWQPQAAAPAAGRCLAPACCSTAPQGAAQLPSCQRALGRATALSPQPCPAHGPQTQCQEPPGPCPTSRHLRCWGGPHVPGWTPAPQSGDAGWLQRGRESGSSARAACGQQSPLAGQLLPTPRSTCRGAQPSPPALRPAPCPAPAPSRAVPASSCLLLFLLLRLVRKGGQAGLGPATAGLQEGVGANASPGLVRAHATEPRAPGAAKGQVRTAGGQHTHPTRSALSQCPSARLPGPAGQGALPGASLGCAKRCRVTLAPAHVPQQRQRRGQPEEWQWAPNIPSAQLLPCAPRG